MPTLQQTIAEKFLAKLSKSPDVDKAKIDQLRSLLAGGKKLKVEDLVNLFPPCGW